MNNKTKYLYDDKTLLWGVLLAIWGMVIAKIIFEGATGILGDGFTLKFYLAVFVVIAWRFVENRKICRKEALLG